MLIEYYFSAGEPKKTIQYINELLHASSLSGFDRAYYQGVKAYCGKDYNTAVKHLKKALNLHPDDKNVQNNIEACLKLQKELKKS